MAVMANGSVAMAGGAAAGESQRRSSSAGFNGGNGYLASWHWLVA